MDAGTSINYENVTLSKSPRTVFHQGNIQLGLVSIYTLQLIVELLSTNDLHLVFSLSSYILQAVGLCRRDHDEEC